MTSRPTILMLIGSMSASAAAGVITAMLVSAHIEVTPWVIVPLLTFIAFLTGAQSLRNMRDTVVTEMVDYNHRDDPEPPPVTKTLASGEPL